MNVEIGAEAALFPEMEYISGSFVAVQFFASTLREQLFEFKNEDAIKKFLCLPRPFHYHYGMALYNLMRQFL
jgi:hypothetical protein